MTTASVTTTQVYQLFIKATPEQVWDAITKSEFTTRYFYASRVEMENGRRRAYGPNGELWGDSVKVTSFLPVLAMRQISLRAAALAEPRKP